MNATIIRNVGATTATAPAVDAAAAEQQLKAQIVAILKNGRGAKGELPYTETVMQLVELINNGRAAVEQAPTTSTTTTTPTKVNAQAKALIDLALATDLRSQAFIVSSSSKRACTAGRAALNDLADLLPQPSHARDLVMRGLAEASSQPVSWFENLLIRSGPSDEDLASRVERHSLHRTLTTLQSLLSAQETSSTPEQVALTLLKDRGTDLAQRLGTAQNDAVVDRKLVEDARKLLVEVRQALPWQNAACKSIDGNLVATTHEDINGQRRTMAYAIKAAMALLSA